MVCTSTFTTSHSQMHYVQETQSTEGYVSLYFPFLCVED